MKKQMSRKEPLVVVITVNYNGFHDTAECLTSLLSIDYTNCRVIVVDNGSQDGSYRRLQVAFPRVLHIGSPVNLGFTGGNNLGLEAAYRLGPKYILLLNNDTVVSSNILNELTHFMEDHPDVGLAGPVACYYNDRQVVAFAGGDLNRNTGRITFFYKGLNLHNIERDVIYGTFVEGTALFIRAELIKSIGGFNDTYFLTSEESELCVRVADLGYRMAVVGSCTVWHKISNTMEAASELATYFIYRNKLFFIKNNAKSFRLPNLLQIISYYLTCIVSLSVKKGNYKATKGLVYGVLDFFRGKSGVGRFRERLQSQGTDV